MTEKGVVLDKRDGKIIVKIERHAACGACKACETGEKRDMSLELDDTLGSQKGDIVEIELDDSAILRGAAFFYGVPLLGLVTGILGGKYIAESAKLALEVELFSALTGLGFLAVALVAVKLHGSHNKERYRPRVVRVVKGAG